MFVSDRQRLPSIHCYTVLILEIGCKFGYLIETYIVTVYNTTLFPPLGSSLEISAQQFTMFPQPIIGLVVILQTNVQSTHTIR